MAFASLEEAWGVATLGEAKAPASPSTAAAAAAVSTPTAARYESPRQEAALDTDEDAIARRVLDRAYRQRGMAGVLALLPKRAARRHASGRRGRRSAGGRGGEVWEWLSDVLSDPDVVLFLLVASFIMLVAWGALRDATRPDVMPSLASLHMSPFPLGTSTI